MFFGVKANAFWSTNLFCVDVGLTFGFSGTFWSVDLKKTNAHIYIYIYIYIYICMYVVSSRWTSVESLFEFWLSVDMWCVGRLAMLSLTDCQLSWKLKYFCIFWWQVYYRLLLSLKKKKRHHVYDDCARRWRVHVHSWVEGMFVMVILGVRITCVCVIVRMHMLTKSCQYIVFVSVKIVYRKQKRVLNVSCLSWVFFLLVGLVLLVVIVCFACLA